jgi:hypothetical protein
MTIIAQSSVDINGVIVMVTLDNNPNNEFLEMVGDTQVTVFVTRNGDWFDDWLFANIEEGFECFDSIKNRLLVGELDWVARPDACGDIY